MYAETKLEPGLQIDDLRDDLHDDELYQDPLSPYTTGDTLRSLLLWPVAIAQMAGWLPVFWLLDRTLLPGRRIDGLARLVCWLGTRSVGIRVRQQGLERIDRDRGYLIALNHVSLLDTPVLVQSVPIYARSFQDAAHFRIPLYGSFVRIMGQLPVHRDDKELNRRSYRQALSMLREGHSFAVFPEGHRTRDGRLGRFYPGAFRLAIEAGVPVLPVCSRGLRELCPAREWRMRPGRVDVLFGEPIPTDELTLADPDVEQLAVRTRARMNALLHAAPGE
jgi:1-acyl-sn-glycerol-3-phosphate acyltransferase